MILPLSSQEGALCRMRPFPSFRHDKVARLLQIQCVMKVVSVVALAKYLFEGNYEKAC